MGEEQKSLKPRSTKPFAMLRISGLEMSPPMRTPDPARGTLNPVVLSSDTQYASWMSFPKLATSPVLAISSCIVSRSRRGDMTLIRKPDTHRLPRTDRHHLSESKRIEQP